MTPGASWSHTAIAMLPALLIFMPGIIPGLTKPSHWRWPRPQPGLAGPVTGYAATAILTALFSGALLVKAMMGLSQQQALPIIALMIPLLALAVFDARYYRLPDVMTLPLLVLGCLTGLIMGDLWMPLFGAALWGLMPLGLSLLHSRLRGQAGLGLGDVKLMAAIGAWLGPDGGAVAVGLGAVLNLVYAAIAARLLSNNGWRMRLPFGCALCLGFFITALLAAG